MWQITLTVLNYDAQCIHFDNRMKKKKFETKMLLDTNEIVSSKYIGEKEKL